MQKYILANVFKRRFYRSMYCEGVLADSKRRSGSVANRPRRNGGNTLSKERLSCHFFLMTCNTKALVYRTLHAVTNVGEGCSTRPTLLHVKNDLSYSATVLSWANQLRMCLACSVGFVALGKQQASAMAAKSMSPGIS